MTEEDEEMGIKVTSKGVKYLVDPAKIRGGGPPKDGIPSIDDPKYVSLEEADEWIEDNELVLAIIYKDVKKILKFLNMILILPYVLLLCPPLF